MSISVHSWLRFFLGEDLGERFRLDAMRAAWYKVSALNLLASEYVVSSYPPPVAAFAYVGACKFASLFEPGPGAGRERL